MQLVWLRNDLRVLDHPALYYAAERGEGVVAVVTLTPAQWQQHGESARRMALWLAQLRWLQTELARLNIPLRVLKLRSFADTAPALCVLAQSLKVTHLSFSYEYPLNERARDRAVCEAMSALGIVCQGYHAELLVAPGQVLNGQGGMYKVFTPFSRAWRRSLSLHPPLPAPSRQTSMPCSSDALPADLDYPPLQQAHTPLDATLWPAGADAVHERLHQFVAEGEADYARQRDFPAREGTSTLSPYLSLGALSPRQCLQALLQDDPLQLERRLEGQWLTELIWREFYRHLLVGFPQLSRLEPFRPEVEARIHWQHQLSQFEAWKRGETGFPLVDAAMKQLHATGWMHNRLRMLVASFLTKLLRIDWRLGAAYFMEQLVDGDFASNLGGWQWCASVGADAAPYFRIFNPQRQSEKFDPEGVFIARWLPELSQLPAAERHRPGAGQHLGRPAPIIDYASARKQALDAYQQTG